MAGPSAVSPPLPPDHERYATQVRRTKPGGTGSFRGAAAPALAHEHPLLLDPALKSDTATLSIHPAR